MKSGVGAKKMEMEPQAEILRIERELSRAREKLGVLRAAKGIYLNYLNHSKSGNWKNKQKKLKK